MSDRDRSHTGINDATSEFSNAIAKLNQFCRNTVFDTQTNTEAEASLPDAILNRTAPDDILSRFEKLADDALYHLNPRVDELVANTTFSEHEAQVFLLLNTPTNRLEDCGVFKHYLPFLLAYFNRPDKRVTPEEMGEIKAGIEEKLQSASNTIQLATFLGSSPDDYPNPNKTQHTLPVIPLKHSTQSQIRHRQRNRPPGTTANDIVDEALDESKTTRPLRDFLVEYTNSKPVEEVVVLTNWDPTETSLHIQGIVDSSHMSYPSSTHPIRGLHFSQNPHHEAPPEVVQQTDQVSFRGSQYDLTWGESVEYDPEYMMRIYSDPATGRKDRLYPEIPLYDGLNNLEQWLDSETSTTNNTPSTSSEQITDADGNQVDDSVATVMNRLKTETDAYKVICLWNESGWIGYHSNDSMVKEEVFKIVDEEGYIPAHTTTRQSHEKTDELLGYAEFTPKE